MGLENVFGNLALDASVTALGTRLDNILTELNQKLEAGQAVALDAASLAALEQITATVQNWPSNFPDSATLAKLEEIRVILAGTQAVAVSNFPATQAVIGTVAVSNHPSSFAVNNFPSTQPVSGTVAVSNHPSSFAVSNFPATQPVSAASLPLPTGAATEATLAELASAVHTEDQPHTTGDKGIFALAVRRDAETTLATPDGDYAPLSVNPLGRLKVSAVPGLQDVTTGTITTNTGTVAVDVSRTSNIAFACVNTGVSGATFNWEFSLNSTNGVDGNWYAMQAIQSNANTIGTSATAIGATPAFGWEASVNGYRWFRIRASAGTFGSSVWTIQPAPYATEPIPAAQVSGTQPVSGTVTANIGTGSLAAGTNAIGDVGMQYRGNATGAASRFHLISAATTNASIVKGGAGRLLGWSVANTNAAWRYVKLHNQTTSPTAGSGVVQTIGVPPNSVRELELPGGIAFTTGIALTTTTGAADADNAAVGLNDLVIDIFFA